MSPRRAAWLALPLLALSLGLWWVVGRMGAGDSATSPTAGASLLGKPLPALVGATAWLDGRPPVPDSLAGRVVVVALLSLNLPSSVTASRALDSWHDAYSRFGLRVIGVQVPEFAFGADPARLAATARRSGVGFPLGLDGSLAVVRDYGGGNVRPRLVVAGADGRVVLDRQGLEELAGVEERIRDLLRAARPEVRFPAASAPATRVAIGHPPVHLGRARVLAGPLAGVAPGRAVSFTAQLRYQVEGEPYTPYPVGRWIAGADGAIAAQGGAEQFVALRYDGGALGAVLGPSPEGASRFWILRDDRWLAAEEAGTDVRFDGRGATYVEVKEPGLYALTRERAGVHVVKLSPESPGATIYAFTFEPFGR